MDQKQENSNIERCSLTLYFDNTKKDDRADLKKMVKNYKGDGIYTKGELSFIVITLSDNIIECLILNNRKSDILEFQKKCKRVSELYHFPRRSKYDQYYIVCIGGKFAMSDCEANPEDAVFNVINKIPGGSMFSGTPLVLGLGPNKRKATKKYKELCDGRECATWGKVYV